MSARCGRFADGRRAERGFTLTELMVVVIITGILSGLAFASLRKQIGAAARTEGLTMVQSIRVAQERWRGEHMSYLDVSTTGAWYPAAPALDVLNPFYFQVGGQHLDQTKWLELRPNVPGPVRFGYQVNAGAANTPMTVTALVSDTDWYVIQASGITSDGDTYLRATSMNGDVFTQ